MGAVGDGVVLTMIAGVGRAASVAYQRQCLEPHRKAWLPVLCQPAIYREKTSATRTKLALWMDVQVQRVA